MEFRELTVSDFDQIVKLQRAYKISIGEAIPTAQGLSCLKEKFANHEIRFFGAFDGELLIGICSIVKMFSTFRYEYLGMIDDLYILTSYRRRGIAKQFIDYIFKNEDCSTLGIFCSDENASVIKNIGFTFPIENTLLKIE
ncbi:MAG: GNAT family N-acetyltransferase [Clostridia bacterium]|nr:GNAT family N-acetyltransferase [Clostridia bacterium]